MAPPEDRARAEEEIRARIEGGRLAEAATLLIETYGSEILGFIMARVRDEALASEAYSLFLENLWRGLSGFEGRATARVWAYTIARHAAVRVQAAPHRKRSRNVPLSDVSSVSEVAERVRTETLAYLRTEKRDRLAGLVAELPPDDRWLLSLKVTRKLPWDDIARILGADGDAMDDAALRRESARLRKRFQLVKRRLRRMADEQSEET